MATNVELRAAAEAYRDLSADIADAMEGFCSPTELTTLLHRLADITQPMQSHILATVPADDGEPVTVASLRQQLADVTKEIGRLRHDLEIAHDHRRFAERECDRLRAELIMSEARRELVTAAYDKAFKIVEVGPNAVAKREDKKLSESARTLQELQGIIEKLRAELLQRELQLVPDLDWLRASFGEPVEKHGGGYLEWHPQMIVFDTHYNNTFRISEHGGYIPGRLPTRAAVLAAVAATKDENDGN